MVLIIQEEIGALCILIQKATLRLPSIYFIDLKSFNNSIIGCFLISRRLDTPEGCSHIKQLWPVVKWEVYCEHL